MKEYLRVGDHVTIPPVNEVLVKVFEYKGNSVTSVNSGLDFRNGPDQFVVLGEAVLD